MSQPLPSSTSEPPPVFFDSERLSLVADNDQERAAILKLFFQEAHWYSGQMRYALQHPDAVLFKEAAHSLRGSASNMGMCNLADLCNKAIHNEDASMKAKKEAFAAISQEIQALKNHMITKKWLPDHV